MYTQVWLLYPAEKRTVQAMPTVTHVYPMWEYLHEKLGQWSDFPRHASPEGQRGEQSEELLFFLLFGFLVAVCETFVMSCSLQCGLGSCGMQA